MRIASKGGAAPAADGRHPWGRPLVPARFRNRFIYRRRCEFSSPALRRRASMAPIPREPRTEGMLNISACPEAGGRDDGRAPRRCPRRGTLENGRGAASVSLAHKARSASSFRSSGFMVSNFGQTLTSGPVHRTVRAPAFQRTTAPSEAAQMDCWLVLLHFLGDFLQHRSELVPNLARIPKS